MEQNEKYEREPEMPTDTPLNPEIMVSFSRSPVAQSKEWQNANDDPAQENEDS